MKRIDAMIPTIKRSETIESILKAGAKGVTVVESRGKGAGDRPMVGGGLVALQNLLLDTIELTQ